MYAKGRARQIHPKPARNMKSRFCLSYSVPASGVSVWRAKRPWNAGGISGLCPHPRHYERPFKLSILFTYTKPITITTTTTKHKILEGDFHESYNLYRKRMSFKRFQRNHRPAPAVGKGESFRKQSRLKWFLLQRKLCQRGLCNRRRPIILFKTRRHKGVFR